MSKDPKKACDSVGVGLGVLSVVLTHNKTLKAAHNDRRYGYAQALIGAGQNIPRAAGNRIPASAKKAFLASKSLDTFVAWCQSEYPARWKQTTKNGENFAKKQKSSP